ncbi:MAG: DUF4349 domain-containing protein [Lachnospiraceae bacterium]
MKKKVAKIILMISALALLCAGCGNSSDKSVMEVTSESAGSSYAMDDVYMVENDAVEYAEEMVDAGTEAPQVDEDTSRKLITTANYSVETDEFDDFTQRIENKAAALGGYVENVNVQNDARDVRSANYVIRIPEANLNSFVEMVSENSNVTYRSTRVDDVTLSYVDLESRIFVLRTEESRLLQMLEEAEDVETMIMVESRLSEVQCDIESMESQLRTFDNRINYSTIYLDVQEVKVFTVVEEQTIGEKIAQGFKNSLYNVGKGISNFFIWLIVASPYLLVIAAVIAGIVFAIRAMVHAGQKKAQKKRMEQQLQMQHLMQNQNPMNGNMFMMNGAAMPGNNPVQPIMQTSGNPQGQSHAQGQADAPAPTNAPASTNVQVKADTLSKSNAPAEKSKNKKS